MVEQGVALEDGVHVALVGRQRCDVLTGQQHRALAGVAEAADHAERGGLAAARGAEQGEEVAGLDVEVQAVDGVGVRVLLGDTVEPDGGGRVHGDHSPERMSRPPRRPKRRGMNRARAIRAMDPASMSVPTALMVGCTPKRIAE